MIQGYYTYVGRKGNNILYRGYDLDGQKVFKSFRFRPTLFIDSTEELSSGWKSLDGCPLQMQRFDTISDATNFIKTYADVGSFRIHGNSKWVNAFIHAEFPKQVKFKKEEIDAVIIDLECPKEDGFPEASQADAEISAITLKLIRQNRFITWGLVDFDSKLTKEVQPLDIEYRQFDDEESLLRDFIDWWSNPTNTPDVITGWNIAAFDIPYLVNRISRVFDSETALLLSPWKLIEQNNVYVNRQEQVGFKIVGIPQVDYLDLFKKFTVITYGQQESYSLDFISRLVLGDTKLEYEEYDSLCELRDKDPQLYIAYNIYDVELVSKIDQVLKLLSQAYMIAYMTGSNYEDCLGTIAIWDSFIFRELANKKIAIPQGKRNISGSVDGGFVKDPILGKHEWVTSFDLNSLYPSLMIQYNMSPETKKPGLYPDISIQSLLDKTVNLDFESIGNVAVAANGAMFSKDKIGHIAQIVRDVYALRVKTKTEMLRIASESEAAKRNNDYALATKLELESESFNVTQSALKTMMNSLYGAFCNQYFRYFDIDFAEAITHTGQAVVQTAEQAINNYLNTALSTTKDRVVACDTDSAYVTLGDVVQEVKPKDPHAFLVRFAQQALTPVINRAFTDFATTTNAYENTMVMKLEKISSAAIWQKKKRYILKVLSSEGVEFKEPKITIKGLEAVKSSTPKLCRDKFKEIYKLCIESDEQTVQKAIAEFRREYESFPLESIAIPCSVSDVVKWHTSKGSKRYKSGTPINSRAAILYNEALRSNNLTKKYRQIKNGDRMKYVFLTSNNPTRENIIGFPSKLPPEFKLNQYIDYDAMFDKAFRNPLQLVLNVLGWSSEEPAQFSLF